MSLISKDNFILFTPMLPEVASGMIEVAHVVTPVRTFCKKAEFHEGNVESIDLTNKKVKMTYAIERQSRPRRSMEFGTIVGGDKGFFIDYTTSARMFLKYLSTTEKMITSLAIALHAEVKINT